MKFKIQLFKKKKYSHVDEVLGRHRLFKYNYNLLHADFFFFFQRDAVEFYLQNGVPAKKIILGLAAYGRTFTLVDAELNGLDSPVSGAGLAGEFTRERGSLAYYEVRTSEIIQKKIHSTNLLVQFETNEEYLVL